MEDGCVFLKIYYISVYYLFCKAEIAKVSWRRGKIAE